MRQDKLALRVYDLCFPLRLLLAHRETVSLIRLQRFDRNIADLLPMECLAMFT